MKPNFPEILPWLARKAGIPTPSVEVMWLEAVRQATGDCEIIESSEFWKFALDHLFERISVESPAHREFPLDRCSLPHLPARYRLPCVASAESVFMSGLKALVKRQDQSGRSEGLRTDPLVEAA